MTFLHFTYMIPISNIKTNWKKKYYFGDYVERTFLIELEIKDTTDTVKSVAYLDLHLEINTVHEGSMKTKLSHKRDYFSFLIVNFLFLCSNIPAAPAYGVYIAQLIRYSRACISYHDFLDRGLLLPMKLLNQDIQVVSIKSSPLRFSELVDCYGILVSQMLAESFLMS